MAEQADIMIDDYIYTHMDDDLIDDPYWPYEILKYAKTKPGDICIHCGGKIIERTNSSTGQKFLGCSEFPNCKFSDSL